MLTLNLISEELKQEIKLRHIYGFVKKINLTLIIIAIVIAIILLIAKVILQNKFNDTVEQMTLVTKTNQGYNNEVRDINNKLNFVAKIQDDFIPWSDLIKKIAEITPSNVSLYNLKLDANEQTIRIKGKAYLRSSLLDFKDNLEATTYFNNIDFPLKNILEKENIDFEIAAKLNLNNIKNPI
jgi:hypothetical protein